MSVIVNFLLAIALLTYPLAVYFGLQYLEPKYIGLLLVALVALRAIALRNKLKNVDWRQFAPVLVAMLLTAIPVIALNQSFYLKLSPVLVNSAFCLVFAFTLARPPSMIERIARITNPDLPPEGVAYTRSVTWVWCGFFILNGSAALYTALFTTMKTWTLYNGLISYLLMGLLFAVEYVVRRIRMAQHSAAAAQQARAEGSVETK